MMLQGRLVSVDLATIDVLLLVPYWLPYCRSFDEVMSGHLSGCFTAICPHGWRSDARYPILARAQSKITSTSPFSCSGRHLLLLGTVLLAFFETVLSFSCHISSPISGHNFFAHLSICRIIRLHSRVLRPTSRLFLFFSVDQSAHFA